MHKMRIRLRKRYVLLAFGAFASVLAWASGTASEEAGGSVDTAAVSYEFASVAARPAPEPASEFRSDRSAAGAASDKVVVFIYHTHNRESFLPELGLGPQADPADAYDPNINITAVGRTLANMLGRRGISAVLSNTDYPSEVEAFEYAKSYAYSARTVREALAAYPDVRLIVDLHRDSLGREATTVTIGGVPYARLCFVVGGRNPHRAKNEALAHKLHQAAESRLPGISRGVLTKSSHGHAEYNQSLSPYSVLVEAGGPYNTFAELYRSMDVLADAIAAVIGDGSRPGGPTEGG